MYSASLKFPGYCLPDLQASAKRESAACVLSSRDCFSGAADGCILVPEIICGFWILKPARIFPLSPTNIIPSASKSLFSSSNSCGMGGRMPPSYQQRSTGGLDPLAGYLNLTQLAKGKEKLLLISSGT